MLPRRRCHPVVGGCLLKHPHQCMCTVPCRGRLLADAPPPTDSSCTYVIHTLRSMAFAPVFVYNIPRLALCWQFVAE